MDIYNYNKGFELLKNRINIKDLEKIEYDREVVLAGWIINIKNIGNISFIILRDQTGDVQITIKKDIFNDLEFVKEFSLHTFIVVKGKYIKGIAKKYRKLLLKKFI